MGFEYMENPAEVGWGRQADKGRTQEHTALHPPRHTHMHTTYNRSPNLCAYWHKCKQAGADRGEACRGSGVVLPDSHQVTEERLAVVGFEFPAEGQRKDVSAKSMSSQPFQKESPWSSKAGPYAHTLIKCKAL